MKTEMEKLIYFALLFKVFYQRVRLGKVAVISEEDGIYEYFEEHIAPLLQVAWKD